jgi:hypothetical protein
MSGRTIGRASWLLATALFAAGCQSQGPAERAGKAIDNAARDARDAVKPGGPAEQAGRNIDRALNK